MKAGAIVLLVLSCVVLLGRPVHADPRDFSTRDAFSWQQVMDCYRSVPLNHDDLENIIEVAMDQRAYSDLDELYDERYNRRSNLLALDDPATTADYPDGLSVKLGVVNIGFGRSSQTGDPI